jgi:hypothetical protein
MGQMYPEQPNIAQNANMGQTQGISFASRPVSSKEEAMAVGADFSGAPMIFPDMANNTIYVKRWDIASGSAVFTEYVPKGAEAETPATNYATQEDFKALADKLTDRLDDIEADLERLKKKGAKKNDDE